MWRTWRTRNPLRKYLLAELATTAVIEGWLAYVHGDFNAPSYVAVYCLIRPVELGFAVWLAGPRLWAILPALVVASLTLWHHSLYSLIALLEGSVFEFAGLSALGKPDLRILAVMWLLLASFDVGYGTGWELPNWANLNGWWPYVICTAAFSLIGWRLGEPSMRLVRKADITL